VNNTKAAEIVIHDFRSAALGRLTLETPAEFADWLASGLQADADRALRKEALQKEKKTARKAKPRN
jgi:ribosome biogenesis GTPase A